MKKTFVKIVLAFLLVLGIALPASALQYSSSYASLDWSTLRVSGVNGTRVGAAFYGFYSTGEALAASSGPADLDTFFATSRDGWAEAQSLGAYALTGWDDDAMYSQANAVAGGDNGPTAFAESSSYAGAYGIQVRNGGDLMISIDYSLNSAIGGDGLEGADSLAGAAAMLGIYSGLYGDESGDWLQLAGSYDNLEQRSGTLQIVLSGLSSGFTYYLYAGTAAYAYAGEPAPVPEPATMFLLGTGLIGIAGFGRKKLKAKS